MKKSSNVFITIMVVIVALIVTGLILYEKTTWFKAFIKWWTWAYNGLRRWHWGRFTY